MRTKSTTCRRCREDCAAGARLTLGLALFSILGCGGTPQPAKASPTAANEAPATASEAPATASEAPAAQPEALPGLECEETVKTFELQSGDLGTLAVDECPDFQDCRILLRSAKHGAVGIGPLVSCDKGVRYWFSPDGNRMFIDRHPGGLLVVRLAALFDASRPASEAGKLALVDDELESIAELSFFPIASLKPTLPELLAKRKWNWSGWHGIIDPPDEDGEYPIGSSYLYDLAWRSNNVLGGMVDCCEGGNGTPFCVKVKERLFKEGDESCR
jgi:hypothetical protein